jgi:hypothetical protein
MSRLRNILILVTLFLTSWSTLQAAGFVVESIGKSPLIEPRKSLIRQILTADKMHFGYSALKVIVDAYQVEPRGKMQGHTITLSASVQRESEFVKLLTHEVAHYIDIFRLRAPSSSGTDPSTYFYTISWRDKSTKRAWESLSNFISWYAASNQYEDFAESFTFYVFHNDVFYDRAMKNDALRRKYLFFSEYLFRNGEFQDTDFGMEKVPSYLWDTTKLPISVKKYLYSLTE